MPDDTRTCVQTKTTAAHCAADPCVATAGIVGGSGYTGALLAELLLQHPSVKLTHVSSETLTGDAVQRHLPRVRAGLEFCREAGVAGVDVAFLCTPHGQAARAAKRLLDDGARVIDLSADFRLTAEAYAEWYGEHPHPELLPGVYGLTELHREEVAAAAIRTTDKHAKSGALDVKLAEGVVHMGLAAIGCGTIGPDMATMLGFCNGASGVEPGDTGLAKLGRLFRPRCSRSPCRSSPTARGPRAPCAWR